MANGNLTQQSTGVLSGQQGVGNQQQQQGQLGGSTKVGQYQSGGHLQADAQGPLSGTPESVPTDPNSPLGGQQGGGQQQPGQGLDEYGNYQPGGGQGTLGDTGQSHWGDYGNPYDPNWTPNPQPYDTTAPWQRPGGGGAPGTWGSGGVTPYGLFAWGGPPGAGGPNPGYGPYAPQGPGGPQGGPPMGGGGPQYWRPAEGPLSGGGVPFGGGGPAQGSLAGTGTVHPAGTMGAMNIPPPGGAGMMGAQNTGGGQQGILPGAPPPPVPQQQQASDDEYGFWDQNQEGSAAANQAMKEFWEAIFGPGSGDFWDQNQEAAANVNEAIDQTPGVGDVPTQPIPSADPNAPGQGLFEQMSGNVGDFLANIIGPLVGAGGNIYGAANEAWQQGNPPPPGALDTLRDLFSGAGYEQTGLNQAVAANMQSMMDPRAWEQMAQNREASLKESLRGSTNEMARRMRGAAAQGGYAANPGLANLYGQYGQNLAQGQREIFNDILQRQMGAAQMAGQYGLGQQGLQDRWYGDQLSQLGTAGMMDAATAADRYTTFEDMLNNMTGLVGGIMGGGGSAAGAGMQAGGGILSSLLPLLMSSGGAAAAASDRNIKRDVRELDSRHVLSKVRKLDVTRWRYVGDELEHLGPMAQDFHQAFEVGTDRTLHQTDVDGVSLAAIQALADENDELREKNDQLEARLERLEAAMDLP